MRFLIRSLIVLFILALIALAGLLIAGSKSAPHKETIEKVIPYAPQR